MDLDEIITQRASTREAFRDLAGLLRTDEQRELYHRAHRRLDKADEDVRTILTQLKGQVIEPFDGGQPKPPGP